MKPTRHVFNEARSAWERLRREWHESGRAWKGDTRERFDHEHWEPLAKEVRRYLERLGYALGILTRARNGLRRR